MDRAQKGKLIISAAKSLKGFRIADPQIAAYLYSTSDAGRLGLFASAIRSEANSSLTRIRLFAAEEGIALPDLTTSILPWLENAGFCRVTRDNTDEIKQVTSMLLAYQDLLNAVSDFYDSRTPTVEDRACLSVLAQANEIPTPESVIKQAVSVEFGEEATDTAIRLAKAFKIVAWTGSKEDPLIYAPRVWSKMHDKTAQSISALDRSDREVLLHLIDRVRNNQGYPESLLRREATDHNAVNLVELAVGVALINRTVLHMIDGSKRAFLTTPHFYAELEDEYGEDMCDRVKIFLDSIRNGQYFGSSATGKIYDPQLLLRALLNRGEVGPATAIRTDYMVAEKAGIVSVRHASWRNRAYLELRQEDTVRKVLEVVASGSVEPGAPRMYVDHMSDGTRFGSIEQARAELGDVSGEAEELQFAVINRLREG